MAEEKDSREDGSAGKEEGDEALDVSESTVAESEAWNRTMFVSEGPGNRSSREILS